MTEPNTLDSGHTPFILSAFIYNPKWEFSPYIHFYVILTDPLHIGVGKCNGATNKQKNCTSIVDCDNEIQQHLCTQLHTFTL